MREVGTVLVVDEDADYRLLVRLSLAGHATLHVVGEAANLCGALALAARLQPRVILADLGVGTGSAGEAAAELARAAPGAAIVAISAGDDFDPASTPATGALVGQLSKAVRPRAIGEVIEALARPRPAVVRRSAQVQLPAAPESARHARRFIEETLVGWDCEELVESTRLLISELVGNAVGHARTGVGVSLTLFDDRLHADVDDDCDEGLRRRTSGELDMSGRGIAIVEALARSWGVRKRHVGKTVWFELPRSGTVERQPSADNRSSAPVRF
ncbi:MAG: ATP-binding protein [Acidimicrobiales bacterium]